MTSTTIRPVIFINPNALQTVAQVTISRATSSTYQPGSISMGDEPAAAFLGLLEKTNGLIVCTASPAGGYDAKDYLFNRGVRGNSFGADWFAASSRADRARGVNSWLARHGNPPAIVIDHGEGAERSGGGRLVTVALSPGQSLTASVCQDAVNMLFEQG